MMARRNPLRWLPVALGTALGGCFAAGTEPPAVTAVATEPHPNSINGQLSRPWHHVGKPVSAQRQGQDEAKCKVVASMTGPSDTDIAYWVTYINCLKASGYEPDPPK